MVDRGGGSWKPGIVASLLIAANLFFPATLPAGREKRGTAEPSSSELAATKTQAALRVDGDRLLATLEELTAFGGTSSGGTSRLAYSDDDLAARAWVADLMRAAGLEVTVDLAGNLLGRRDGSEPGLAPLTLGSHIDSVPDGGNFDGQIGSMAALEVARALADAAVTLRHPLVLAIFQNEEGGKTGSRALVGEVQPHELDIVTASGNTIADGIRLLGGNPERLDQALLAPGDIAAYLELHIEQGAVLDGAAVEIGVVEGIVGIKRWNVTVAGFANHAGTTPMDARSDALLSAARLIQAVDEIARSMPGRQVATVGRISASPGAPNVIPGEVTMSLEIRDLDMDKIDAVFEAIRTKADRVGQVSGTSFRFDDLYVSRAAPTDGRIRDLVARAASDLGLSSMRLPSGAGHDAQSIAQIAPVGMIFIPSVGGISHSPQEFSRPADVVAGANVLLLTLLKLDEAR